MDYKPAPIATGEVALPADLAPLLERLAENVHEHWALGRLAEGWTWGPRRDDALKHHPDLVPYDALSEDEKAYDRRTAGETLKAVLALGYQIVPA